MYSLTINSHTIKYIAIIVIANFLIIGCATSTMSLTEKTVAYNQFIEVEKLEQMDRIYTFRYDGWSSLGDQHLILSTGVNKSYLITFNHICHDLRFAQTIAIHKTGSSLMAKFDAISVPESMGIKCFIKSIYKLTKEQRKALRVIGKDKNDQQEVA